ncbi:MAG: hypothetical protein H6R14_2812 [Proteobacteria bacterium]|nr:hypothetical protein [Pseudomonadota bacterium]
MAMAGFGRTILNQVQWGFIPPGRAKRGVDYL